MVNFDALPLFPLHVVLYPEMPLPLHIFEPRYREMIGVCRRENAPFGIVLIQNRMAQIEQGKEVGEVAVAHAIGTTARISQQETLPDGRMNLVVVGETRFRVTETQDDHSYLTARVEPFWDQPDDLLVLQSPLERVAALFKAYLKALGARMGRPISALQLPQDAECLSYAVASVLQIELSEKQQLLEVTSAAQRLEREVEILTREIEDNRHLPSVSSDPPVGSDGIIVPVDPRTLSRLSSLN